jgi:hypothetical protein
MESRERFLIFLRQEPREGCILNSPYYMVNVVKVIEVMNLVCQNRPNDNHE